MICACVCDRSDRGRRTREAASQREAPQSETARVVAGWSADQGGADGVGGYGWARTTDLSIMSAAL
jgi:hypothetical protein